MKEPVWLTMAKIELGVKEVPGDGDNPIIAQYWRDAGLFDKSMGKDSVSWCASFANAMLHRGGANTTGSALAKSFLKYGIKLRAPALGAICVYQGPEEWQGHVNFYLGHDTAGNIVGIGGNQGDAVSIAPFKAAKHLGYFWPKGFPLDPEWVGRIEWTGTQLKEVTDR